MLSYFCYFFKVMRVPSYSPSSIAEYAIAQIMVLAKNFYMSYVMTKRADFDITSMQVKFVSSLYQMISASAFCSRTRLVE